MLNTIFNTTFAVFLPTPGSFWRFSRVSGITPLYSAIMILHKAMIFFAFVLYNPIDLIY